MVNWDHVLGWLVMAYTVGLFIYLWSHFFCWLLYG